METVPDPRDLPPDPRLPGEQPRYSRDNIVTALLSFYESLPHVDPSLIRRAPPGGWTEITPESLAAAKMRPAERVIDLIGHLPFIDGEPQSPWITPETFPINYHSVVTKATAGTFMPGWMKTLGHDHFYEFPPWVFQLTTSVDRDGDIWLLDTMDGTVTKYIITGAIYPEPVGRYEENDPRVWRQVYCDDDTLTLEKWLDGLLEKYKTLQWFGIPRAQHPGVFGPREYDDEESESYKHVKELKRIYAQHGWPNRYNGDDCRQRLLEWAAKAKE